VGGSSFGIVGPWSAQDRTLTWNSAAGPIPSRVDDRVALGIRGGCARAQVARAVGPIAGGKTVAVPSSGSFAQDSVGFKSRLLRTEAFAIQRPFPRTWSVWGDRTACRPGCRVISRKPGHVHRLETGL